MSATVEKTIIDELGLEDNATQELVRQLGGVQQPSVSNSGLYTAEFRKQVDEMEKVPVYVPGKFAWSCQINGLDFIVNPEQLVMVPRIVKEVMDNQRAQEQAVERSQAKLQKLMNPGNINEIREYVR